VTENPARPGVYTHGHHESVLRSHSWRTAENSAGYLLPHLRRGMSVLDVGCGPGTITRDLATLVAPGAVVGIEVEAGVVATAQSAVGEAAEIRVGDVYTLDPAEGRYDVVHAHQVLQHVPDPVGALRSMAALARPGGLVAARDSDYRAFAWYPRLPELDEWMTLYQRAARANGGEPDAGRHLMSWALAAGLDDLTPSASVWCFATPEDRAWWGGMWADRILESALARQLVDQGMATHAELRRISAAWQAWATAEDGWIALLHGEILARTPG
jgi:2-polyprenyl-3-methyl-5-hydroxy-6-metoxy-1,4-benzoquinol methylase